ncbi:uncharacterized protein C4orf36 homolog [Molossus nigricans]|uniref:Uncharacterized protein n=1 Tax=Molossus molossus TaxID=27622 RepID=A0A7J8JRU5_MOLMO|nr:uncharacterized protein C4orf36 homolog [Molossus molossus]KAF6499261.1 hypothetical protein HJG59_001884 [Molossus molossus]
MAYGLPRKNTVKNILRGSYNVQQPWDLALLTESWYTKLARIKFPFLEEITFGGPVYLKKCNKMNNDGLLPSAEDVKLEREYELKRLNNLKCQENAAEEIQFALREKQGGLRRPLPPK